MASISQEEVAQKAMTMQRTVQQTAAKINELEGEMKEHELVCECLGKVPAERRCWRMIGGVLVERTVKEVLPAVADHKEKISGVVTMLKRKLQEDLKKLEDFKAKHNVQAGGAGGGGAAPAEEAAGGKPASTGVLVW
eukprot:CAMPEP_0182927190 /NCGR_PEP_ID=MMETSP0105_2-20130417/13454_1 /TAXON_ID=81532 ORGANISM="Acanthoeca-like sp., Strain 10tr" /NCGR_SAMPLE_ID=MMETSP0105_2 /ASSEMBLY_ACC=CAM_ASM_000205 /LENGTH=136 /DNA_ID=CAMNT_0025065121 /DNA_START=14 /DNA_END=422 /DNA_ORIENTATION=-